MNQQAKRLAIIGGGASGLAAAVAAGECARKCGASLQIDVFERDDRVGRSILATGNGRCNFSNSRIDANEYHNGEFAASALKHIDAAHGGDAVHEFFCSHGLEWREEEGGRQYPLANKASVVVDVLRASAKAVGVRELCEREVASIDPPRKPGGRFTLRMSDGVFERADAVIVACGGRAMAALEACGLNVLRLRPVLGPLRVADADVAFARELDNIRVRCRVSLARKRGSALENVASERGELMFRKYGVSGICVFNLSRFARQGDSLLINFLPALDASDAEGVDAYLRRRLATLAGKFGNDLSFDDMLRGLLLPRVSEALLKREGVNPHGACTQANIPVMREKLVRCRLEVKGMGADEQCQVRRGGLDVDDVDPATMAVRDIPGLFAAGEALDVDGPCGGYNLHWAWSSGLAAGKSAAALLVQ